MSIKLNAIQSKVKTERLKPTQNEIREMCKFCVAFVLMCECARALTHNHLSGFPLFCRGRFPVAVPHYYVRFAAAFRCSLISLHLVKFQIEKNYRMQTHTENEFSMSERKASCSEYGTTNHTASERR